jgi:hypothetical protein
MTINPWLDSIMNLEVFAFIGLLVWLYFKPDTTAGEEDLGESKTLDASSEDG